MEKHITFTELILVMLFFGTPVFIAGRVMQLILLLYYKVPAAPIVLALIISQIIALVIETIIWRFCKTDPMFHFVSLPAIGAEILILMATLTYLKNKK